MEGTRLQLDMPVLGLPNAIDRSIVASYERLDIDFFLNIFFVSVLPSPSFALMRIQDNWCNIPQSNGKCRHTPLSSNSMRLGTAKINRYVYRRVDPFVLQDV